MVQKVFALFNKAFGRVDGVMMAPTAGLCIRDNSPYLVRAYPHFEEDCELVEIGSFDESLVFRSYPPITHSWSEYKKPESSVSPIDVEKLRKE